MPEKKSRNFPPRQQRKSSPAEKDDELRVPLLMYGEKSNLLLWMKRLEIVASQKFGKLAMNVLRTNDYGIPEPPDVEEYDQNPGGFGVIQYREDLREYRRDLNKIIDNKVEFYYFMYGRLSAESVDAIKRRPDFEEFHGQDPLALWMAVKESHGVNENYQDEVMMRMDLRKKLKQCRQSDFESITDYHERYVHCVNSVNEVQEQDLDEADMAMDFFDNLNDRSYGEFKAQFTNDVNQGKVTRPENLVEMYAMASRFVPTIKPLKAGTSAAFATRASEYEEDGWQKRGRNSDAKKNSKSSDKRSGDHAAVPKEKNQGNKDKVKCFNCQGMGHYANECPSQTKTHVNKTSAAHHAKKYRWFQVLLDNQADKSVVNPRLLNFLRQADAVVTGITGDTIPITERGHLAHFFECLSTDKTGVSVLSFAEVEALYNISYIRRKCFIVHLPERDLIFRRKRNMYVADMRDWEVPEAERVHLNVTTSAELEKSFTPLEVKKAREAQEFMNNAGIASERDAVNMLNDGDITGAGITATDVRNAGKMYGQQTEFLRGKMTQKAVNRVPVDPSLKDYDHINQALTSDVMHLGGKQFLITLAEPLELLLVSSLEKLTADVLLAAIQGQVDLIASRGYKARVIHMDPQPGFRSLKGSIAELEFDEGGAGDHAEKIDQKIRRLKELVRSVFSGLPWNLPKALVNDVVLFGVSRLNMRRGQSRSGNVATPRVLFTGRKPSFKKEFSLSFGDYVECYKPGVKSNDALAERSDPCLALYPTGNASGSWVMFNIKTRRRVRRTNWRKMVTTQLVIDAVNQLSVDETNGVVIQGDFEDDAGNMVNRTVPAHDNSPVDELINTGVDQPEPEIDDDLPDLVDESDDDEPPDHESDFDEEGDDEPPMLVSDSEDEDEEAPPPPTRTSARIASGLRKPERYMVNHMSVKRGLSEYGEAARTAVCDELKQLFIAKKAMHPVMRDDLSQDQRKKIIKSFMFLKAKFDGMGVFEKIKARLVANGSQQDLRPKIETASPTVAMDSVMMCLSIAAKEGRSVATADIGGAYLNADMDDEEVLMELEPALIEVVRTFLPNVDPFVDGRGKMVVKLDKALYGCVQSALLWYQTLAEHLTSLGFTVNKYDKCVWNRNWRGSQITIMLYVDDLLITCKSDEAIDWLLAKLEERFVEVKNSRDGDLSYLGMHIKWGASNSGKISVSMESYVKGLLQEYGVTGSASSPADKYIFDLDDSALMSDSDRKEYHTIVAKLLYLANRTRPDIMLAISFLTTRVTTPTIWDRKKLWRVLKYLNSTPDKVMTVSGDGGQIEIYVDAAFALHPDAKSHTGVIVKVFGDTVLVKSSKQKIVTRDSTEAELVALSDKILIAIRCYDFLTEQGVTVEVPVVYQDNTSTISLVTNGGGKYRNKYIHVRQQVVLQMFRDGDVKIVHVRTGEMDADVCTKPLQGELGRRMVSRMLGDCII